MAEIPYTSTQTRMETIELNANNDNDVEGEVSFSIDASFFTACCSPLNGTRRELLFDQASCDDDGIEDSNEHLNLRIQELEEKNQHLQARLLQLETRQRGGNNNNEAQDSKESERISLLESQLQLAINQKNESENYRQKLERYTKHTLHKFQDKYLEALQDCKEKLRKKTEVVLAAEQREKAWEEKCATMEERNAKQERALQVLRGRCAKQEQAEQREKTLEEKCVTLEERSAKQEQALEELRERCAKQEHALRVLWGRRASSKVFVGDKENTTIMQQKKTTMKDPLRDPPMAKPLGERNQKHQ